MELEVIQGGPSEPNISQTPIPETPVDVAVDAAVEAIFESNKGSLTRAEILERFGPEYLDRLAQEADPSTTTTTEKSGGVAV